MVDVEIADSTVLETQDKILLIVTAPEVRFHWIAARMAFTNSNNTCYYAFFEVFNVNCRDDQSILRFEKVMNRFLQIITAGIRIWNVCEEQHERKVLPHDWYQGVTPGEIEGSTPNKILRYFNRSDEG